MTIVIQPRTLLLRAYAAYNTQDLERLLTLVADDVDWPGDEGGRLHGKDALPDYWAEQWRRTRTHDQPIAFVELDDGRLAVHVNQQVRSLDGTLVSAGQFVHLFRVNGDRIADMEIVPLPSSIAPTLS